MRKSVLFIFVIFLLGIFISCDSTNKGSTAEEDQTKKTDKILDEINAELGLPDITNFQMKRTMKMVNELCDKADLICYAYLQAEYSGKLVYIGRCIGFGVPFSAQYTNPEKLVHTDLGQYNGNTTLPQADPNGLYMPTSSQATWLLMVNPANGDQELVYFESTINVSTFPLHKMKE
jgi:hypothetical protein